jgi:hypothetical protein
MMDPWRSARKPGALLPGPGPDGGPLHPCLPSRLSLSRRVPARQALGAGARRGALRCLRI